MDDGIYPLLVESLFEGLAVDIIGFDLTKQMLDAPSVRRAPLENNDLVTGLEQGFQQVAAEKAGGAGEENGLGLGAVEEGWGMRVEFAHVTLFSFITRFVAVDMEYSGFLAHFFFVDLAGMLNQAENFGHIP